MKNYVQNFRRFSLNEDSQKDLITIPDETIGGTMQDKFVQAIASGKTPSEVPSAIRVRAKINGTDTSGRTPLMAAIEAVNKAAVKELLETGADPNLDAVGLGGSIFNPIEYAATLARTQSFERRGMHDIVRMLRDAGAELPSGAMRASYERGEGY